MSSVVDEDDPWSYSFPPSLESLPLKTDKTDKRTKNVQKAQDKIVDDEEQQEDREQDQRKEANEGNNENENGEENAEDEEDASGDTVGKLRLDTKLFSVEDGSKDDTNSVLSTDSQFSSAAKSPIPSRLSNQFLYSTVGSNGHESHSSLSLQSPFVMKPCPAETQITKEDANSILSKDSDELKLKANNGSTPKKSYLSGARSSLQQAYDEGTASTVLEGDLEVGGKDHPTPLPSQGVMSVGSRSSSGGIADASPKVISYRRSRAGRPESDGNIYYDNSTFASPKEKFDTRLYVDEKYKDTIYRYTTIKRNTEFHQLFPSLDLTDRLLDDFSCALSRAILLQGRLYVSENHVCFNSNLLGWVTNLIIEQSDIIRFEKKLTAGLFPNGLLIETKDAKHNLASLISRDSTFEFMKQVWQGSTGKIMDTSTVTENGGGSPTTLSSGSYSLDTNGILQMDAVRADETDVDKSQQSKFESYILSIDGDDNPDSPSKVDEPDSDSDYSVDEDEDEDEDEVVREAEGNDEKLTDLKDEGIYLLETEAAIDDDGEVSDDLDQAQDINGSANSVSLKVIKFKSDSKYINMGPEIHAETNIPVDYVKDNDEIFLCKEQFDVPIGIVFNILYGSESTEFHKSYLEDHDASEITEYSKFHPLKDDPAKLERSYSYRKALGYTIGPKSTKCEVVEYIEHLDFNEHIIVLTSTVTPDVPLGNSFSVWTRYCLSWGPNNSTILQMSYFIKWTGRSWIRSVIEKQSLSGQKSAAEDLVAKLKTTLEKETVEAETKTSKAKIQKIKKAKQAKSKAAKNAPVQATIATSPSVATNAVSKYSFNEIIRTNIVTVCYFIFCFLVMLLILQLKVFQTVNENNQLLRHQLLITSHLVSSVQSAGDNGNIVPDKQSEGLEDSEYWNFVQTSKGRENGLSHLEKVEFLTTQLRLLYLRENDNSQNALFDSIEETFNEFKQQAIDFNYQDFLNVSALKNAIGDLL